jgi:uncharacterized protein (DUF1330 family)
LNPHKTFSARDRAVNGAGAGEREGDIEACKVLAFAPFLEFIRGMSGRVIDRGTDSMKINLGTSLALLAGVALGAMAVQGLHAQATPPTYAVIDDSVITDPAGYAAIGPKGGPSVAAFGGKFVMRTDKITASDGTPPQRIIVIAFENLAQAKAWRASPAMQEIWAIQEKTSKSRIFFAEGMTP